MGDIDATTRVLHWRKWSGKVVTVDDISESDYIGKPSSTLRSGGV